MEGKLEQDLAPMVQHNGEEQVKLRSEPIRSHDDMKWIISFKKDQAKC